MQTKSAHWEALKAVEQRAGIAIFCAIGIAIFGVASIRELQALEAGRIAEVRTFTWILGLYRLFGVVGVGAVMALVTFVVGGAGAAAMVERKAVIAQMGEAQYRAARRAEDGNSTLRSLILLGVLVAVGAVFAAFHFGLL